jgi:MFS family permease
MSSSGKWARLGASFCIMSIGCGGQYAMSVALLPILTEFGASRSYVSFAYTLNMVFFGLGGIVMGRLFDRFGTVVPVVIGAVLIAIGFVGSAFARTLEALWIFYGVVAGLGGAATFAPLIADAAMTFDRNRGLAVAICATGNYFAGVLWPPVLQYFFDSSGWRPAFTGAGVLSFVAILPLALFLRGRPVIGHDVVTPLTRYEERSFDLPPEFVVRVLSIAGVGCCVAMAMPQVHLVAYCGELGYSAKKGAELVSVLFVFGIISRLTWGVISDRIGGMQTLFVGSSLQAAALLLFLTSADLPALYFFSGFFGLVQGGIVPAYAMIVRAHFPGDRVGQTTAIILMATLGGMALGGFLPGVIFDYTGSYTGAFVNAFAFNALNLAMVLYLFRKRTPLGRNATVSAPTQAR